MKITKKDRPSAMDIFDALVSDSVLIIRASISPPSEKSNSVCGTIEVCSFVETLDAPGQESFLNLWYCAPTQYFDIGKMGIFQTEIDSTLTRTGILDLCEKKLKEWENAGYDNTLQASAIFLQPGKGSSQIPFTNVHLISHLVRLHTELGFLGRDYYEENDLGRFFACQKTYKRLGKFIIDQQKKWTEATNAIAGLQMFLNEPAQ